MAGQEDKGEGGLEIIHKDSGLVEDTVGRLFGLPKHMVLWTPRAINKDVPSEMVGYLKEKWKDVKWKGNVEVYLNHSPLFRQLKRLYSKERRTNLLLRVILGTPATIISSISGKLGRADLYNPYTETAQVYHANSAVGMHEIGHANVMDKSKHPGAKSLIFSLPGLHSKLEWDSSRDAMVRLTEPERDAAKKVLEPAFGTHAGFDFGRILRFICPPAAAPYEAAGALLGHIHARLFKRNIFFNEDKVVNKAVNEVKAPDPVAKPAFAIA